jgi:pimeloyl-ACP methyl ester carboxylesterase
MNDALEVRVHGSPDAPTLVYLPGIHGDWTLVTGFRLALQDRVRFIEFCYPRTTEWTLSDYAGAVRKALNQAGIRHGWLIGESFGSQVAWGVWHQAVSETSSESIEFHPTGLVLAGGFVQHPWIPVVRWVRLWFARAPTWALFGFLWLYRAYAQFRFRGSPVNLAACDEFLERRRRAGERAAILHRLDLIIANDLRPAALVATGPIFSLTGFWDPIVPWPWVRAWLKRHCPGWRCERILPWADHTVLVTQSTQAAEIVWAWISPATQSRATNNSR